MRFVDRVRARILACFTDEIVAVSEATAEVMAKTMWLPRRRIKVVVNGVAGGGDSGFRIQDSGVRITLGIPDGAVVIGTVGRLAHVKGQDRLIAAFAALSRSHTSNSEEEKKFEQKSQRAQRGENYISAGGGKENFSLASFATSVQTSFPISNVFLLLIGDGPERAALEKQAGELGVADRVIFAGYQAEPGPYYRMMDLFVLPSRSEGLSISLLEAMAAGVPVAVTDVGANREVIADGQCGVLLPEDEKEWGRVLKSVLADPDAIQARVDMAKRRVQAHYSLDATLDGYERLYGNG